MRLHLHEWGDAAAPPLVFLHGVTSHGGRFARVAREHLGARRTLAPDLRGHGHSGWDEPWTLEAHVEDVLETVSGLERADWVGYSFGGRLLIELAARAPERIERAVLLDPALFLPADLGDQLAEAERREAFASPEAALEARLAGAGASEALRPLVAEEVDAHLEHSPDGLYRFRYSDPCVAAAYRELGRPPPPFGVLTMPTLLLVARESKLVSAAELELLRRALGDRLAVEVVPGPHAVLWAAAEATGKAVSRFLA